MMYVRLLGEVAVADGAGWRRAGAARQAGVLAVLAMSPGRPVSLDTIANRLWGSATPATSRSVLYAHIARLRRLIEPLADIAITRSGKANYRLDVDERLIDVFAMRSAVDRARKAVRERDHAEAVIHWRRAGECRQGRPLGDVDGPWADRTRRQLSQEWNDILAGLFDSELALGNHTEILGALREVADQQPHSETFAAQLMRALYLDGRQADALARYAKITTRMRDDLGVDPGEQLQRLHRAILRQDPELCPRPKVTARSATGAEPPRQLPPPPVGIVGRQGRFDDLNRHLGSAGVPILLVTGMAGVGKTSVVLHWAHQVAERFGDGQLFVDLKGFDAGPARRPSEVLAGFLAALGIPGRDIPDGLEDRLSLYRSRTADKALLVVLDNAAEAEQVRLLSPTGAGSLVLVTSRNRLSGLVARDGAHHIGLDVLTVDEAKRLLVERLGSRRVAADPRSVAELIELCGRLPLALRIAAAQLSEHPGSAIADHVRELTRDDRLQALSIPGDSSAAVRPAFEASYLRLDERSRAVFRCLGQFPGPDVSVAAVAALTDGDPHQVKDALRHLVATHLVQPTGANRFGLHDLLKEYARRLADGPAARQAWERLAAWYVHTARAASNVISPGSAKLPVPDERSDVDGFSDLASVMAWFDAEVDNLLAVFRAAAVDGPPEVAWLLAEAMRLYLGRSANYPAFKEVVDTGLELALRHRNLPAVAAMRSFLAFYAKVTGDLPASIAWATAAVRAARDAGDTEQLADALTGRAGTRYSLGRLAEAVDDCDQALRLSHIGLREHSHALGIKGKASRELGRLQQSLAALRGKAELLHRVGEHRMAEVDGELALTYLALGELPAALESARRASATSRLGNPAERAVRADTLACVLIGLGELDRARDTVTPALDLVSDEHNALFRVPLLITVSRCHPGEPKAVEYAESAVDQATRVGGLWVRTDAQIAAAQAHLGIGDHDMAVHHARQAKSAATEHGYRLLLAEALTVLARAADDAGQARELSEAAARIVEECRTAGAMDRP